MEPHIIPLKVRLAVALKVEAKWQVYVRDYEHWNLLLYRILMLYWAYTCNFAVYCVLFVMMSTNIEKIQLFQRREMSWQVTVFSGRKLGQYADQELLKSLFQNKTLDLRLKYMLIQVHDQQGQQ